jgi:hypothetical protein
MLREKFVSAQKHLFILLEQSSHIMCPLLHCMICPFISLQHIWHSRKDCDFRTSFVEFVFDNLARFIQIFFQRQIFLHLI